MIKLIYLATCLIIVACLASPSICGPRRPFSLVLAPPKEPLKAGQELPLLVTVTNTSNRDITFARSSNLTPEEGHRYQIEVQDAQGHPALPSAHVLALRGKDTVDVSIHNISRTLARGESFVDQVTVTTFYDLSQPGNYTISVAREIPPHQSLGKGTVESNKITITVVR